MSIAVLVERRSEQSAKPISVEEWKQLIAKHSDLRVRVEPYSASNPRTGATFQIQIGDADSEIRVEDQWLPFLRWQRGKLVTEYCDEFENEHDPMRQKIVAVSRELGAAVYNDVEDDPLGW